MRLPARFFRWNIVYCTVHVSRTIRILADFKLPIAPYLKYSFAIFLFLLYRSYCSLSSAFVFAVGTMIRSAPFLAQVRMLSGTILPVHHYPYLYSNGPHIPCDTAEKTVSAVFPEKRPDHSFLPYHSISGFYQGSQIFLPILICTSAIFIYRSPSHHSFFPEVCCKHAPQTTVL